MFGCLVQVEEVICSDRSDMEVIATGIFCVNFNSVQFLC